MTTSGKDTDDEDNGNADIQPEIQHILCQLNQVKRRLGPAAERSAEAYNSKIHGNVTTGRKELENARRDCNPMEVLGEGQGQGLNNLFINRSAMKLANIDAALGFFLTTTASNGHEDEDFFSFADLCASPGGFSK
jgi:cap1 methyltransferase